MNMLKRVFDLELLGPFLVEILVSNLEHKCTCLELKRVFLPILALTKPKQVPLCSSTHAFPWFTTVGVSFSYSWF